MKKFTKPQDFKIRETDPGECTCIVNGEISPFCLINGVCSTLKIVAVFPGFPCKEKKEIGKVKRAFRKNN